MNDKLNKLLDYLIEAVELGKEQVPQAAQELLTIDAVFGWIQLVIGLNLFLISIYWQRRGKVTDHRYDDHVPFYVLSVISAVGGGLLSAVGARTLLYIHFAPKLYILNYLRGMITGGS